MTDAPDNPFWAFSLVVYARPGVAEACLVLQDRHGLDVNLLLFCLWAGRCGRRLDDADLAALQVATADWQREVVQPLRAVRRFLKDRPLPERAASEPLRRAVKRQELEAERLEQARLHATMPLAPGRADAGVARGNLIACLEGAGVRPDAEDRARLDVLLAAALRAPRG